MLLNHTKPIQAFQHRFVQAPRVQIHHQCPSFLPHVDAQRTRNLLLKPVHATEEVDAAVDDIEEEEEYGYCMPSDISVDNASNDKFTVLQVQVKDYPGLFRVIAWVLTGLDLCVEAAEVETSPEGIATNTFWLVNRRRKKLNARAAELLAERISDYVRYCTPTTGARNALVFANELVEVQNNADDQYTVVLIKPPQQEPTALLNVASVLTGIGLSIHKGQIESQGEALAVCPVKSYRFWLSDGQGKKLEYNAINSMMYTLKLVLLGKNTTSATPPVTAAPQ